MCAALLRDLRSILSSQIRPFHQMRPVDAGPTHDCDPAHVTSDPFGRRTVPGVTGPLPSVDLRRPRLLKLLLLGFLAFLVIAPNVFAVYQLYSTGGYLFYTNAFDEPTYLSYDGAVASRSMTRLSAYVIVALHKIGMSGGYINLVFDVVFPITTVIFLARLSRLLGFSYLESISYSLFVLSFPVCFGYSNPYYSILFNKHLNSPTLHWITLPQAYYPAIFRTPEPQLSLCVAAAISYLSFRVRSYTLALSVAPLLYPFVSIPYAFFILSLLFYQRSGRILISARIRAFVCPLSAFALIAIGLWTYYRWSVAGSISEGFLPQSHLPLLSGSGTVAIMIFLLARRTLSPHYSAPMLFLALAPFVGTNTQIISGFFEAPNSFEQNSGEMFTAIVLVLALRVAGSRRLLPVVAGLLACGLLAMYSSTIFRVNSSVWQRTQPSPELLSALRKEPQSLLIGDPDLADIYGLIGPKLHYTALARSQTYANLAAPERFQNYLCVKLLLTRNDLLDALPADTFAVLDRGFRYLNEDFVLIHLNRKKVFKEYFDPQATPIHCDSRTLKIFPSLVLGEEVNPGQLLNTLQPMDGANIQQRPVVEVRAPNQQWAYAAMAQIPLVPETRAVMTRRWLDLKVRATPIQGCIGFGVLSPDQSSFVKEALVSMPGKQSDVDLIFQQGRKAHWLVVRNCSSRGASSVKIDSMRLFPIQQVTVRSVEARIEGKAKEGPL